MVLDILVFILIVLITMYLATQGMLSSLLALATATFSCILAMALMEPLQGIIAGFRPDYARGCTFLLLFLVIFSATRIGADMAVPKTIKVNLWVNRIVGGFVGFFTALVVMGTLIIGMEMLPLTRSLLGFDRFPSATAMQAVDAEGQYAFGETARPVNIWFAPDRFVEALWNGASGRSLGGNRAWTDVHPDIVVESYGYRTCVLEGSRRSVSRERFELSDISFTSDPAQCVARGIPAQGGKKVVLVRTKVSKGEKSLDTADEDGFLRTHATQVRLVTDKDKQYYPIGWMAFDPVRNAQAFRPLTLDRGFAIDDYVSGVVIDEWVFAIGDDEKPTVFEIKQFGRDDQLQAKLSDKLFPVLSAKQYPQHSWEKDLGSATVTFDTKGAKLIAGHLYVLKPDAQKKDINSILNKDYDEVFTLRDRMDQGTGGWSKLVRTPGVPTYTEVNMAQRWGSNFKTDPDDTNVNWAEILPVLLISQATSNGQDNIRTIPNYMDDTIDSLWRGIKGSLVIGRSDADASNRAIVSRLNPQEYFFVVTMQTDSGYHVWVKRETLAKNQNYTFTASPDAEQQSLRLDLNDKPQ